MTASTAYRLLGTLLLAAPVAAQAPHVQGRVTVRPSDGALDASLCTSRFVPRRPVRFLLSAPLSIKHVTDGHGRVLAYDGEFDGRIVGEAREYVVRQADSLPPLATVCVEYRGAVPVFDTNSADSDWKGRIAAINGILRASDQTRWYPTLFDRREAEQGCTEGRYGERHRLPASLTEVG